MKNYKQVPDQTKLFLPKHIEEQPEIKTQFLKMALLTF